MFQNAKKHKVLDESERKIEEDMILYNYVM